MHRGAVVKAASQLYHALAREADFGNMALDAPPARFRTPSVANQYCRIAWVHGECYTENLVYRGALYVACATCLMISYSIPYTTHEAPVGGLWICSFPHWIILLQFVQQSNDIIIATTAIESPAPSPGYMRFVRLGRALAQPLAVHNALVFTMLNFNPRLKISDDALWTSLINAIIATFDVLVGTHRAPRVMHVVYSTGMSAVYLAWTAAHYKLGLAGQGKQFISPMTDWRSPDDVLRDVSFNLFAVCPLTIALMWALMYARERLRFLAADEERDDLTGLPVMKTIQERKEGPQPAVT